MERIKKYIQILDKPLFILFLFSLSFSLAVIVNYTLDLKIFTIPNTKVSPKKMETKKQTSDYGLNYLFPQQQTKPTTTKKTQINVDSISDIVLKGTIKIGNSHIAIVSYKNKTYYVKVGNLIGKYRVKKIDNFYIVLQDGNKEHKIYLAQKKRPQRPTITQNNNKPNIVNRYKIKKSEITKAKIQEILRTIAIAPATEKGKLIGWKVLAIQKDSPFYKYGLRSGDIIISVNGLTAREMSSMTALRKELENSKSIDLEIKRGGETITIYIDFE